MIAISGVARSGTSLAMKLVVNSVPDESRVLASKWMGVKKERRDLNPDGFWECRYTMEGARWHDGIEDNKGKICKITSRGIARSNPSFIDKIVIMARHPRAVAKSQERIRLMLPVPDGEVHSPRRFITETVAVARWLARHPKETHVVNYDSLIENPTSEAEKLGDFLGFAIDASAVKPKLRRSTPEPIESDLWPHAEAIFSLLLASDFVGIAEYFKANREEIQSENELRPCARLGGEPMAYNECINCIMNNDTRRTFRDRAEEGGHDWRALPCNFIANPPKSSGVEKNTDTVSDNHWADTLAPPPPPITERAKMALAVAGRVLASVAAGRRTQARKDVVANRRAACRSCKYRVGDECSQCSCPIARAIKWADKQCPKGRWQA